MGYTPVEQIYEYFRQARGVVVDPDLVGPGDLFFAFQRARPKQPFGRWIWTVLETVAPALLGMAVRLVVRLRLYRYIAEDRVVGNSRAGLALERGATYAVVDNGFYRRGSRTLLVKDVGETLATLAEHHRHELPIPLVGITGSNGKTTTKELVRAVLGAHYVVTATPGTANGVTGAARVILSVRPAHEMAVVEMGITGPGQLSEICQVVQPTSGLITNIGPAHLRRLKNLAGVQAAKGELFDYLRAHDRYIFLNVDDPRVVAAAGGYAKATTYGTAATAQIQGEVVGADPYLRVRVYLSSTSKPLEIQSHLAGVYNLPNILAALTVGEHFGVPSEKMAAAIEAYEPVENRSQVILSGTNRIILDAYNANLGSMRAALDNFERLEAKTKILILGDMWDLGDETERAHREILEQARALKPEVAVFVGQAFGRVRRADFGLYFRDVDEARRWYSAQRFEYATILIKGAGRVRLKDLIQ
jgi:UDP-N-acetylmuramoyl-tripeptide--D-alanyl-D-alanine ligase